MTPVRNAYYLRLSVTQACDLRCLYCRPALGCDPQGDAGKGLEDEELALLVSALHGTLNLHKVRLTGGEPLLRRNLPHLVLRLREALPGSELALTTNGRNLAVQARALRRAGLNSLNVSLDAASPADYRRITRGGSLTEVLEGILAAKEAGFTEIKLNAVLLRSQGAAGVLALTRLAGDLGCEMRFIELMPYGEGAGIFETEFMGAAEAVRALEGAMELRAVLPLRGTSRGHVFRDGKREIRVGFITTMSNPFCSTCDRLRLDSAGRLLTCLRREEGVDLAPELRQGDFVSLRARILEAVCSKSEPEAWTGWPQRSMAGIGG